MMPESLPRWIAVLALTLAVSCWGTGGDEGTQASDVPAATVPAGDEDRAKARRQRRAKAKAKAGRQGEDAATPALTDEGEDTDTDADTDVAEKEPQERQPPRRVGDGTIESPADGTDVDEPWVTVLAKFPRGLKDGIVSWKLDGEQITADPLGVLRQREGKTEYIGALEVWDLEPGQHTLSVAVRYRRDAAVAQSTFRVDKRGFEVRLVALNESGPTAARVLVLDKNGDPLDLHGPNPNKLDKNREELMSSVFVLGEQRIWLKPEKYTFVGIRGPADELSVQEVRLREDRTVELQFSDRIEAVSAAEWSATDFHVHTAYSPDSFVPLQPRWWSLVAAGLDVAVLTDHNKIPDIADPISLAMGDDWSLLPVQGVEARIGPPEKVAGHYNVFPTTNDADMPDLDSTAAGPHWLRWRRRQHASPHPSLDTKALIQLNHPRGVQVLPNQKDKADLGLFSATGFDPEVPLDREPNAWASRPGALDVDLLEIYNRYSWSLYREVRADWFHLLDQGHYIAASGNSDSHGLALEVVGFPTNYVHAPPPTGDKSLGRMLLAAERGASIVSTGPIVNITVGSGDNAAGPGDVVEGRSISVKVTVSAPSWVPVHEVRLISNGRVLHQVTLPNPLPTTDGADPERFERTWSVSMPRDGWIVAEAGWFIDEAAPADPTTMFGDLYPKVAPNYVPVGFTNPIRVDADSNGEWKP